MGYIRHHAIIVAGPLRSHGGADIDAALGMAIEAVRNEVFRLAELEGYGSLVSGIIPAVMNGTASFVVAPDGSKEGWEHSHKGDLTRNRIVTYLETLRYGDGSTSFKYAEIQFGDDGGHSLMLRNSDEALAENSAPKKV